MKYSEDFEQKRRKINEMCKVIRNTEDPILAKTLYSVAYTENAYKDQPEKIDAMRMTSYNKSTDSDLMKLFLKDNFKSLKNDKMTHLFQELYNRTVKASKNEPRYVVSCNPERGDSSTLGYMEPSTNVLNLNGYVIDTYRNKDGKSHDSWNASTIGPMYAYVLLHETEHTIQMENVMNYATHNYTTKEEKARGAMSFMKLAVEEYAYKYQDSELIDNINEKYWFDYDEHDANMAPMYIVRNAYKNGVVKDSVYADVMKMFMEDSVGIKVDNLSHSQAEKELQERTLEMEKVANYFLNVFKKKIKDGPVKQEVVDTLDEYMKVDENGDSPFRNRMREDFAMCNEVFYARNKYMQKNKEHTEEDGIAFC